ncbi:hypothetical protein V6N11_000401 [Hibiscus sabdariffa]|uniref:Uncharacterized protein n=2 Tax=Hibiscus sabdariffa TaxID=183260 RepID=A0ABR2NSX0_9ROSI
MAEEATAVKVKAATARESTLQVGETSKVAVNEETTKGREQTAKGEKQRRLSVKMARFEAKSRGGGYAKEVTRLSSQEKFCPAYRKKGVPVIYPGHWDKPNGKGNHSFLVRVEEKGLVDCSAQCPVGYKLKKSLEKPKHVNESTTASPTRSTFSASSSKECPWMEVEDDAINAVLADKEFSNSCFMENCTGNPLGEEELMGMGLKDSKKHGDNDKINDCLVERGALNGAKLMQTMSWERDGLEW